MANISTSDGAAVYRLTKWLGLNESPDGDTGLKLGEAAAMRNFRVTRENHLQIRPGYAAVCTLSAGGPVRGLWYGYVKGEAHLLAACGGTLWDVAPDGWDKRELGTIGDQPAFFFGFSGKVYILTGTEYYVWDGQEQVRTVEGYIPVVVTAVPPEGGGTLLEPVNLLTGKRRGKYSPDGTATVFRLPEAQIDEVISVEGTDIAWTADLSQGTVTFAAAPEKGVNTLVFTWRKGDGSRAKAASMRFAEFYNGEADTRVFLYGDGTNECIYSDLDENGVPSAEYFPEMNVMAVDSANTPVTGLIRHYDNLLVFKPDGAFCAQYGSMTLDTGQVTAAFYTTPVNRQVGNAAAGQVRLIRNDPCTLSGHSVYQWTVNAYGTRTERCVKRVSDRVENTLAGFDPERSVTFDDEQRQELYICCGDEALIHNYGNDTWYFYDHFPVRCVVSVEGEIYFGDKEGHIMHLSRNYRNDALEEIDAYWESGSMDLERDWKRKYCADIWVAIKPESQSRITVTAQSNRRSDHAERVVSYGLASFGNANFAHWAFGTNRKPQVQRVRLKVKKFTFCKLIFRSVSASATGTVLGVDIRVRYAGKQR